jgi:1,4-dihydroxy-6-naphthoate synthase
MKLSLGISTCPNDTFMFHGILERRIDLRGFDVEVELRDIQELNRLATHQELDCAKVSCFAAAQLSDAYEISSSGAAVGFGVGPLLLKRPGAPELGPSARVLCPGDLTTAGLLYRRFFPGGPTAQNVVFSEIMPALTEGRADYGVVIHEGRFTFSDHGLELAADLGALWESTYGLPLPLGCLVISKRLPPEARLEFQKLVRSSIEYGLSNRAETLATMKRYAQELDDAVIWAHVDLYVNEWSVDTGREGRRALETFTSLVRGDAP